uniref:Uncharacterized protein n=1 Tax=Panagrolaimus sp. JU765 TaxID=591449 RepID=A0AC34QZ57_9BILA
MLFYGFSYQFFPGSLLNDTIHPEILKQNPLLINLIPPNTSLDQCDLFNLTFSSTADENVFKIGHGHLSCRCPLSRTGVSCQNHNFKPEKLIQKQEMAADPFAAYMVLTFLFMCAMIALFLMMRGCFCDIFGGCRNPFKTPRDEPLDPAAVSRCLEALNEYEKKQNVEVNRPLISTISEGCAPYNDTVYLLRLHIDPSTDPTNFFLESLLPTLIFEFSPQKFSKLGSPHLVCPSESTLDAKFQRFLKPF